MHHGIQYSMQEVTSFSPRDMPAPRAICSANVFSDLHFAIAYGTCHGNQFLGAKSAKLAYLPSFIALAFRIELEYRNVDGRVNSDDDLATSCENLENFFL